MDRNPDVRAGTAPAPYTVDELAAWLDRCAGGPPAFEVLLGAVVTACDAEQGWLLPLAPGGEPALGHARGALLTDSPPAVLDGTRLGWQLRPQQVLRLDPPPAGGQCPWHCVPLGQDPRPEYCLALAWDASGSPPDDGTLLQIGVLLSRCLRGAAARDVDASPSLPRIPGVVPWFWQRATARFLPPEPGTEAEPSCLRHMARGDRAALLEALRACAADQAVDRRYRLEVAGRREMVRWQGVGTADGVRGIVTTDGESSAAGDSAPQTMRPGSAQEPPVLLYVLRRGDAGWQPRFISPALAATVGLSPEALREPGRWEALVHPDDLVRITRARGEAEDAGGLALTYRIRDGRRRYRRIADQAVYAPGSDGTAELTGIWFDLSSEDEALDILRESEERYRGLLDDAPAMICRYRADYSITYVNRACADYFRSNPEDMVGRSWLDFLPPAERDSHLQRLMALSREQPVVSYEICQRTEDHRTLWQFWSDRAFFGPSGVLEEIQSVGRDNTDLRQTQEQLTQAGKMATLGVMVTGVAHELNQPLNVMRLTVRNTLAKLAKGDADPAFLQGKLERLEQQVRRASDIVDHMRMFGRTSRAESETFDINHPVADAVLMTDNEVRRSSVVVDWEPDEGLPPVRGFPDQVEQVLLNLIVNARDAIVSGAAGADEEGRLGVITIRTGPEQEGMVPIIVSDTGGGIPEPILQRVFEPFFTTKDVGKGTGLGLSLSYGLMKDMGGDLSVSNREGGAEFRVWLPAAPRQGEASSGA